MAIYRGSLKYNAHILFKVFIIMLVARLALDLAFFLELRFSLKDVFDMSMNLIYFSLLLGLITYLYPVKLSKIGITSFKNSSIRSHTAEWHKIKSASVQNFWIAKFISLYDENDKELVTLPYKGLTRYNEFIENISHYAGTDHPLTQFLEAQD